MSRHNLIRAAASAIAMLMTPVHVIAEVTTTSVSAGAFVSYPLSGGKLTSFGENVTTSPSGILVPVSEIPAGKSLVITQVTWRGNNNGFFCEAKNPNTNKEYVIFAGAGKSGSYSFATGAVVPSGYMVKCSVESGNGVSAGISGVLMPNVN